MNPRTLWEGRIPLLILTPPALWALAAYLFWQTHPVVLIGALPFLLTLWFFRDPPRSLPEATGVLLSPADGVVRAVDLAPPEREHAAPCEGSWPNGAVARISIFLSVFDVHVNRSPCEGRILFTEYRPGTFVDAREETSAFRNEAMTWHIRPTTVGSDPLEPPVVVRQIAGKIARRIVAWKTPGDSLAAGERFGMIRFGSRTDLFLPDGWVPLVNPGEKVRASSSIVAFRTGKKCGAL